MRTNSTAAAATIALATVALAWPASGAAQEAKPATARAAQEKRPATAGPKEMAGQFAAKGVRTPAPQGFSVVLVLGEMQGNGAGEGVPAAARKALADMKDFLPYKGYRLLDTQWTLCCGNSPTVMRLRGSEEQDYELELTPRGAGPEGKWYIRFALREPNAGVAAGEVSSNARQAEEAAAQKRELENRLRALREQYSENHPDTQAVRAQIAEMEQRRQRIVAEERAAAEERFSAIQRELSTARAASSLRSPGRSIIDTSFAMDIGETVVVGTSRLKGDKALIALLTAVPAAKTNTR
jgi:hypothetical protein